jgi:hypothetical protein
MLTVPAVFVCGTLPPPKSKNPVEPAGTLLVRSTIRRVRKPGIPTKAASREPRNSSGGNDAVKCRQQLLNALHARGTTIWRPGRAGFCSIRKVSVPSRWGRPSERIDTTLHTATVVRHALHNYFPRALRIARGFEREPVHGRIALCQGLCRLT